MAGRLNQQLLTTFYSVQQDELGSVWKDAYGRVFRYVKASATLGIGDCAHISSTATSTGAQGTGWRVAKAASAANSRKVVGVCIGSISNSTYGYVLCGGPLGNLGGINAYVKTNKSVQAADIVYKSAVTGGMTIKAPATGSTAGFNIAVALGSDSGSFLSAGIVLDRFGGAS